MKHIKFLFLALLLIVSTASSYGQAAPAQTYSLTPYQQDGTVKTNGSDTTSGTDTTYLYPAYGMQAQYGDVLYCWVAVPSVTGTTTGTVTVQGSNTGTFARTGGPALNGDWVNLTSSTVEYNGSSSISISGSTATYGYFHLPSNAFKYTRIRYTTSGTQTSYIKGCPTNAGVVLRKHD